jgi:hypothetical protein
LHAFTLRASPRRLDWEFNFRPDGGPASECAARNRSILAARLGISLENTVWLDPNREGPIRWVSDADRGRGAHDWGNCLTSFSGLATDSADLFLCTLFSDDAVVLLYDPRWYAVGLVIIRASRPSPEGVREAMKLMAERVRTQARDVIGVISPSIGPCCHRLTDGSPRRLAEETNLWDFARMAMLNAGLLRENITSSRLCTGCLDTRFFSRKIEGAEAASGAIVIGIRGGERFEAVRAEQRAHRAQSLHAVAGKDVLPSVSEPSLTEEERRLNRAMRCPYGRNKVYIRSSLDGASRAALKPVLALRCDIMAHVGQAAAGYNIVFKEYIERFCCADCQRCPAYQEFSKRRRL